ncbi:MAG TPA: response regulator [Terriglobales bacterium]|jgi:DNA-binding response OmpR family regulator
MLLQALLISVDPDLVAVLRRCFESVGLQMTVAAHPETGVGHIAMDKYDCIVVDCDDMSQGVDIVRAIRSGKSNRHAIIFAAIHHLTTQKQAFELGANFVLQKPMTQDRAMRSLRAAHSLILRERRRYHREPVNCCAKLNCGPQTFDVTVVNVSEGGMLLAVPSDANLYGALTVRLQLPDTRFPIEASGQFVWRTAKGHVGVRVTSYLGNGKVIVDGWLTQRIETAFCAMAVNA